MTELLKNAWLGWYDYTSGGKLAVLFLTALIYLWLTGKWKAHKALFFYAVSVTLCCVLPPVAAVLMLYQTRFYDYIWLWSLVPLTAVTAWAAVEVTSRPEADIHASKWKRRVPVAALLLIVLTLSSGTVENVFDPAKTRQERQVSWEVLRSFEKLRDGEICLWAPQEILAYVREFDGSVSLLYGRDMWDHSLGAYTYDIYPDELRELYLWMDNTAPGGVAEVKDEELGKIVLNGTDCVAAALEEGANCILLPDSIEPQTAQEIAATVDAELSQAGGYYLLTR